MAILEIVESRIKEFLDGVETIEKTAVLGLMSDLARAVDVELKVLGKKLDMLQKQVDGV